tara:strand:- start:35879 stop:37219 length:1341 start_codon:yes stop_codon:yes gene_type:complete
VSELERGLLAGLVGGLYLLFCLWCHYRHRRATARASGDGDILVAYASQTGNAIKLAQQSARALNGRARLMPLNQVDSRLLSQMRQALFVASTCGDGDAPDNAAVFTRRVLDGKAAKLPHLRFAVLALGDSQYPDFCAFGQRLHTQLAALDAQALAGPLLVDSARPAAANQALAGWREQLQQWWGQAPVEASELPEASTSHWVLQARSHLNPGSPGEPLFYLRLSAATPQACSWQPGDIAEVTPPGCDIARHYSIASLPEDGSLDLVIRRQRDAAGRPGLASGWLTRELACGAGITLRISDNPLFRPPATDIPLILIGNGSGIAGLRAQLRWRELHGGGRNWLLFGERDPASDHPFAGELDHWLESGHLDRIDLAFSRCPERACYVQDILRERSTALAAWLADGAVIMVCGSRQGMARGVHDTLVDVLGRPALEALIQQDRYRRDVY